MSERILVTGGAGYIGSHTIIGLQEAGYDVVVVDNLSNSNPESLKRVEQITGKQVEFHDFDLQDRQRLDALFQANRIDAVIHFAGLKAVGESTAKPLLYYGNNLGSTLSLLETMRKHDVSKLVFSSSATVYGDPQTLPITEDMPRSATNPYGHTKLMIEQMLEDMSKTNDGWNITSLRYFNPIGAHPSGSIGEDPNGIPNNLLPYVCQVATGRRDKLTVFGDDYATPDGTGVRDYIHVMDLAAAHLAALQHLDHPGTYKAYNIGTGAGTSVLELVKAFEEASGVTIPYQIADRRPGDIDSCYADVSLAARELDWKAERSVTDGCADSWRWQSQNPHGYADRT